MQNPNNQGDDDDDDEEDEDYVPAEEEEVDEEFAEEDLSDDPDKEGVSQSGVPCFMQWCLCPLPPPKYCDMTQSIRFQ